MPQRTVEQLRREVRQLVSLSQFEYGIGKCSWSCQTWPPGWPVHIQFQDPNKLRKEQLIEIIESMMGAAQRLPEVKSEMNI